MPHRLLLGPSAGKLYPPYNQEVLEFTPLGHYLGELAGSRPPRQGAADLVRLGPVLVGAGRAGPLAAGVCGAAVGVRLGGRRGLLARGGTGQRRDS